MIHELTSAECLEVLGRTHLGRLGCARLNQPYIVPIHFSFDAAGKCVYAFSTVGHKVHWMRDNPKVCLEVEEIVDKHHWTTVLANGLYKEIQSDPDETEARNAPQNSSSSEPSGGCRRLQTFPGVGGMTSSSIASKSTA